MLRTVNAQSTTQVFEGSEAPQDRGDVSPGKGSTGPIMSVLWAHPWVAVLGMIGLIYLLTFYVMPGRLDGVLIAHVITPLMWLGAAAATFYIARRENRGGIVFSRQFLWVGLLVGTFQVAATVLAGMLQGFGESPYASNPVGMLTNLTYLVSVLVGMEVMRAYLVGSFKRDGRAWGIGVVVIVFGLVAVSPARFVSADTTFTAMQLGGQYLAPNLAESLLATYLVFLGGPIGSLAYRGALVGFEWFSPILPDLPWMATFMLGTIPALVGLMTVQSIFADDDEDEVEADRTPQGMSLGRILMTAATGVLAVVLLGVVLLNFGFMGFRSMVVITGSMSPEINVGDIVITREIPAEDFSVGDVVRYSRNNKDIVHRVIEVVSGPQGVELVTKGDANNSVDSPPLRPDEIQGEAMFRVPRLGWLTILLSQRTGN